MNLILKIRLPLGQVSRSGVYSVIYFSFNVLKLATIG